MDVVRAALARLDDDAEVGRRLAVVGGGRGGSSLANGFLKLSDRRAGRSIGWPSSPRSGTWMSAIRPFTWFSVRPSSIRLR